jgi:hypothetical protein
VKIQANELNDCWRELDALKHRFSRVDLRCLNEGLCRGSVEIVESLSVEGQGELRADCD